MTLSERIAPHLTTTIFADVQRLVFRSRAPNLLLRIGLHVGPNNIYAMSHVTFYFSLCPHVTFYKTLTSLSTVFYKRPRRISTTFKASGRVALRFLPMCSPAYAYGPILSRLPISRDLYSRYLHTFSINMHVKVQISVNWLKRQWKHVALKVCEKHICILLRQCSQKSRKNRLSLVNSS